MIEGFRIVIDEDGYPRELITASDFRRAIAVGGLTPEQSVTVYRTGARPEVRQANEITELRPLFGIIDGTLDPTRGEEDRAETSEAVSVEEIKEASRPAAFDPSELTYREDIGRRSFPRSEDFTYSHDSDLTTLDGGLSDSRTIEKGFLYWAARPLTRYAQLQGRSSRMEFWCFNILAALSFFVAAMMSEVALGLTILALIVPCWAVLVRRLHDFGWSGWLMLVSLIPYVGPILLLILTLVRGDDHANSYGPYPLG